MKILTRTPFPSLRRSKSDRLLDNPDKPEAPVLRIKEDSSFELPGGPTEKAKVLSVQEDRVRLSCQEKEFDLLKDVAGAENLRVHGYLAGEKVGQVVGPVTIHADVPKGLALERSGEQEPFPRGIPSNITYSLTLEQLKKIGLTAGPKCVTE